MQRERPPIGIRTFRKIREGDFYYADRYRGSGQRIHLGLPSRRSSPHLGAGVGQPGRSLGWSSTMNNSRYR